MVKTTGGLGRAEKNRTPSDLGMGSSQNLAEHELMTTTRELLQS